MTDKADQMTKVCVRIPKSKTERLLAFAKTLREETVAPREPGWDAKAISRVALDHYGGPLQMFERHGWPERGSAMTMAVQRRVKETYGSVEAFVAKHEKPA